MSGLVAFVVGMLKELAGTFAGAGEPSVAGGTGETAHDNSLDAGPAETHAANADEQNAAPPTGWAAAANDNLSALYAVVAPQESPVLTPSGRVPSDAAASSVIDDWIEAGVIAFGDLPNPAALQFNASEADDVDHSIAKAFDALQRANALFDGGDHDVVILDTPYAAGGHGHFDLPFA